MASEKQTDRTVSPGESATALDESEIFHILGNDRRREIIIQVVNRSSVTVSELAEEIARREEDGDQSSENLYKSVYVSLQQTHLPKLAKEGVIEYDKDSNTVRPGPQLDEVSVYVDESKGWAGMARAAPLVLSLVGLAVVGAALAQLAVVSAIAPATWGVVFLFLVAVASGVGMLGGR